MALQEAAQAYQSSKMEENQAKANGKSLGISTRHAIEICSLIRNRNLDNAKKILNDVALLKSAVPFRRFKGGVSHKKKIGPGRYPIKAAKEIIKLLESAEANAQFKGLGKNLVIKQIKADLASRPWHFGRQRRIKMKRTNIEVVVEEVKGKKEDKEKVKKELKEIKK